MNRLVPETAWLAGGDVIGRAASPSDARTSSDVARYVARTSGPGRFCSDAENCTSAFGILYEPSSLSWVRNVPRTWQNCGPTSVEVPGSTPAGLYVGSAPPRSGG